MIFIELLHTLRFNHKDKIYFVVSNNFRNIFSQVRKKEKENKKKKNGTIILFSIFRHLHPLLDDLIQTWTVL